MAARSSKGAYHPGAQGHSLAEAIEGSTPTGVSGGDTDPPAIRCRWKGCGTFLSAANHPRRVKSKPAETSVEEDQPEESGVHESIPPEPVIAAPELEPVPGPKKTRKGKHKKQEKPAWSDEGLCYRHKTLLKDIEMGLVTDVTPEFND